MNIFSAKDAILEQGIAKTFEQSVFERKYHQVFKEAHPLQLHPLPGYWS